MSFWAFLNHWWNLPSLVMLGLVGVYFALQTAGLVGHDADVDAGVDHDLDLDGDGIPESDVDGEQELDHDADSDADHDAEHDVDGGPSVGAQVAGFLGVGRAPFMVVGLSLFVSAGFGGLFMNKIIWDVNAHSYPGLAFPLSTVASLGLAAVITRMTTRFASRFVDMSNRGSARKRELLGAPGVVASARLDADFGEIRVRDSRGEELIVHARLHAGDTPLSQGTRVVLTEFDEVKELFTAAGLSLPEEQHGTDPATRQRERTM
ncbi:MAG: DUF1449 family protein [Deltaproteobacteria bacterium]|nr:DUF1449 family protein [Deltaproteobacteria bacterium]